jgi:hypothetical protein
MRRAWILVCCLGVGCIPDLGRFKIGGPASDAGVDLRGDDLSGDDLRGFDFGGLDLTGVVAGPCVEGPISIPACGAPPHFLVATSSAAGITVSRQPPGGGSCPAAFFPVAGPAGEVAELGNGDLAVVAGDTVAIASGGALHCVTKAGSTPIDLFAHEAQFAIAWGSTSFGLSDVQLWNGDDIAVASYDFTRITQSAFASYELIASTQNMGAGDGRSFDADQPTNVEPAYDVPTGVMLGAVAGDGSTRMAWVGLGDEDATVFLLSSRASTSLIPWECPQALTRAIPTYGNANTYRLLAQDGSLWTLDTQAQSCTADGVTGIDAIGLSGAP